MITFKQFFIESTKIAQNQIDKIIELRKQGVNAEDIAKQLNISVNSVYKYLPEDLKLAKVSQDQIDKIIELRKQGISVENIAKQLNIVVRTVYKSLPEDLKRGAKITQDQIDKIIELRKQGVSAVDIAKQLNISRETVFRYLPEDLKRGAKITQDQIDKIIELRKKGISVGDIAKQLNISRETVSKNTPKDLRKAGVSQNLKDKIIELRKQGISVENIAKQLNIVVRTVYRYLPKDLEINVPLQPKIRERNPLSTRFINFLLRTNSKSLKKLAMSGPNPISDVKKFADILIENNFTLRQIVEFFKNYNVELSPTEQQWVENNRSKAGIKAQEKIKHEFKQFKSSDEGKKLIALYKSQKLDKQTIIKKLKEELSKRKEQAKEKGEVFVPNVQFAKIPGKLTNREYEFKSITPYVNKMPETLKIISLPADYQFEKQFVNKFNKNLEVYGFRLNEFDTLKTISKNAEKETGGKVKTVAGSKLNVNNLLISPSSFRLKDIQNPLRVHYIMDKVDLIDLDYLGIPGTLGGVAPMRLNPEHNPFLYPAIAAKNLLKDGGLLFVTYTAYNYQYKSSFFNTNAYLNEKDKFNYIPKTGEQYSKYLFKKTQPPKFTVDSIDPENTKKSLDFYKSSVPAANVYVAGIMNAAKQNGVNLELVYTNIYAGIPPYVMWRGVFQKV
jgi:orotate phosphoribosyltransferase-like protein